MHEAFGSPGLGVRLPAFRPVKLCGKCGDTKPLADFNKNKTKPDGYQGRCRACQRTGERGYYRADPSRKERITASTAVARRIARAYVSHYLTGHPCVDCGEPDVIVLEFDHVRGVKLGNVSDMVQGGCSVNRLAAEIEKCDVRCANCHRRVTHRRRTLRGEIYERV